MNKTIPNSNAVFLSWKEWLAVLAVVVVASAVAYNAWFSLEKLPIEPDYRSTCWDARMSDYYGYMVWSRYARDHYKVLLIGDSVVWGQEVANNETISHFLNQELGGEPVANLGIDGLTFAAFDGMVRWYGGNFRNANVLVETNTLWVANLTRDMRKKGNFHHPRLAPQFDKRIVYFKNLDERIGYVFEHILRIPPFVRHIMVNSFDNKSVSAWLMDNPYRNPFTAVTLSAPPMMKEKQGLGTPWLDRRRPRVTDEPFVPLNESVMWGCYIDGIKRLKAMHANVFVLLGPFNTYDITDESREKCFATVDAMKKDLDALGVPYFDSTRDLIPSREFGDNCHALAGGHAILAKAMTGDAVFRKWYDAIK